MKKNTKQTKTTKGNVLVKPYSTYTKDQVRSILKLSKGSALSPKYYPGMSESKVPGSAIISYLDRARRVKVGRAYASGTVTVVAR